MQALIGFTARSMRTARPRPFGAAIVHTKTGKLLLAALNNVAQEFDPSAHAEVRAIRLATKRLNNYRSPGTRFTPPANRAPCA